MDYKTTLNLPKTDFPMKANLKDLEPRTISRWQEQGTYRLMQERNQGKPAYILHDGPPYANGHIHIGHALNKTLKDIIVKYKSMSGFAAPYVPGWDCHGLPIEHQVLKNLGPKKDAMSQAEIRKLCREYAGKFIDIQRDEFKRLGVFGDWDNPYLTMNYPYEAAIVRELGKFVGAGGVYKGKKPVYWCGSCETALAEAEVEYGDHESPSVYVKFRIEIDSLPLNLRLRLDSIKAGNRDTYAVIWTTTPWTIPANLAIAVHPELSYDFYVANTGHGRFEVYLLATALQESCMKKFGYEPVDASYPGNISKLPEKTYVPMSIASILGKDLKGIVTRHPLYDRESKIVLADYVTTESGTGLVHTAPGHGLEDYETGVREGLDVYAPVDHKGRFTKEVGQHLAGQNVFKANRAIIELLSSPNRNALLKEEKISHSYPHCWRCKHPVIFRATEQWFISMQKNDLLKKVIENANNVAWVPGWGKDRFLSMVQDRPDWCISRQRAWGVSIVAFTCKDCNTLLLDKGVIDHVADIVEKEGADIWFTKAPAELLPSGTACKKCGRSDFEKEMDILDVWFDSGVSQAAVLKQRTELSWPADLYLEGSDQHRGWFQSSLLASVGTTGKAPYKTVLTHGFTMDGQGKKMSKSAGNTIAPQEVIDKFGAEVLRLWVSSSDYRDDQRISQEILTHLAEAYRRIRNTSRYLLGTLSDFDPGRDAVADDRLLEIDRWALHRLQKLTQRVGKAYDDFEFHIVLHSIHNFCAVDMSAFYLDILKDRLYTAKASSAERRSGQTVMHKILSTLVRLMAPVLSFTADEVWTYMPGGKKAASVFLADFPRPEDAYLDDKLEARWEKLQAVRGEAAKVLEALRKDKKIGHSLDAGVTLYAEQELYELLKHYEQDLPFIFIASQVTVAKEAEAPSDAFASDVIKGLRIAAGPAKGRKCGRCWMYQESVGTVKDHPQICGRCAGNLA